MNIKTILALCAMTSMVTAAPAEELEKRACTGNRFCCETFFPVNIFFIRAVGSNCIGTLQSSAYPTGASDLYSPKDGELPYWNDRALLHQQSSFGKFTLLRITKVYAADLKQRNGDLACTQL